MTGPTPGDDFDYLFEPIAGDTTTEAPVGEPVAAASPMERRRGSIWLFAAGAVVGVAIGVVLMWPDPVDAEPMPEAPGSAPSSAPASTSAPVAETPASPVPPAPPPAAPPTTVEVSSPAAPPTISAVPAPSSAPPVRRPAPTPSLRTPFSVSPPSRPPFPNQQSPTPGDSPPGGLLGGGGIL